MSVMTTPETVLHPARSGPRSMTAEDLWAIPRVGAAVPSPDGKRLAVPVTTYDLEKNEGRTRLWLVPADGRAPVPFTGTDSSSGEPAFSPDGRSLAFIRKGTGTGALARPQLHVMPLDGGEARRLTDLPLGAGDPTWLPDGSGIVVVSALLKGHLTIEATAAELERRDKDPVKAHVTEDRVYRYWDRWLTTGEVPHLFLVDAATGKARDLTPEATVWFDFMDPSGQYDLSPDGKQVAFAGITLEASGNLRSAIYTVPVAGGPMTCATTGHPADDLMPRWRPEGGKLVYGMQHDPMFYADRVRLMEYDAASGTHREIAPEWHLSPAHWCFGHDGTLFVEAEDNARVALFALTGTGLPRKLVSGGTVTSAHPSADGRVYFGQQDLVSPPEVWSCRSDGSGLARLTRFTDEATSRYATGEVREMTLEGAYGETVQMYVALPPGFETGKKYPLLMVIHGGPHGISGDQFHWRWNGALFAAPGYITAMINFQGSTSWGQDFAKRLQGAWGDRPLGDTMKAVDVLVASGMVDETRMAAAGGSYGGYMASWIEAQTDRFRCIVNHAGVFDLVQQYGSDVTQGRNQSMGGDAWDGQERIDRWSPARHSAGFRTPMLVIHGERDYRVPVGHALECYGILKAKGVPARLVYFPDENHWILKPRNSVLWYREVHEWLARWLGA